jgi:hypothetical protein
MNDVEAGPIAVAAQKTTDDGEIEDTAGTPSSPVAYFRALRDRAADLREAAAAEDDDTRLRMLDHAAELEAEADQLEAKQVALDRATSVPPENITGEATADGARSA